MSSACESDASKRTAPCSLDLLELHDYRNYESIKVKFSQGLNVIHGENGQGKTNLLEAAYLLGTGRVLRGIRDHEVIREGSARAVVRGESALSGQRLAVMIQHGARKSVEVNGCALPRSADLLGLMPCEFVGSSDLPVLIGDPSSRRLFMDVELSQLFPGYLRSLAVYKRSLEHRNALIRQAQQVGLDGDQLDPWEKKMAEHGQVLRRQRRALLERIAPAADVIHSEIGAGEALRVEFEPNDAGEDYSSLLRLFAEGRPRDLQRGGTGIGPHRDDIGIRIDGREARLYGSQGQQRTALLAIKLAMFQVCSQELGVPPILMLDDVFSDLDVNRRSRFVQELLKTTCQALLTCTEPELVGNSLLKDANLLRVSRGTIAVG